MKKENYKYLYNSTNLRQSKLFHLKRAQIGLEFILIAGVCVLLFTLFCVLINEKMQDRKEKIEIQNLLDSGYDIQNKFFLASTMYEGMQLNIIIPKKINKREYSINILNDKLYIEQGEIQEIYNLPKVNGTILKGEITLINENGEVRII